MGMLFAQGGVRMCKNGVLMVNTPGYVGVLRRMSLESRALWSFEGEAALDQEDLDSVASEDNIVEMAPGDEVSPAPQVLHEKKDVKQTMPAVQGFGDLTSIVDQSSSLSSIPPSVFRHPPIVRPDVPAAAGSASLPSTLPERLSCFVKPSVLDFSYNEVQSCTIDPTIPRSMSLPVSGALYPTFPLISGLDEPATPSFRRAESYSMVRSNMDMDHELVQRESDTSKL